MNREEFIKKSILIHGCKYLYDNIVYDLKFKQKLQFDFGILDENNNLKYLLEFNGKQHYFYNKYFFKNEEDYQNSIYRDELKIKYCNENNIPLYIIKYNQNVEIELNKILK